jgi:hypothetical protein
MEVLVENPQEVQSAEIIVGIPSYNEADCIAFPTDVASRGLINFFLIKKLLLSMLIIIHQMEPRTYF